MSDIQLLESAVDRSTLTPAAWASCLVALGVFVACYLGNDRHGVWAALGSAACFSFVSALVFMAFCAFATNAIHSVTTGQYVKEFLRRSGITDASSADRGRGENCVVVLFSGCGLPGGAGTSVWLALVENPTPVGRLVMVRTPSRWGRSARPRFGHVDLTTDATRTVLSAVAYATTPTAPRSRSTVVDGFPFSVTVYRDGTRYPVRLEENLAGSSAREDAACRLAEVILEVAESCLGEAPPYDD